ncbi:hypothetical protein ENUP19_0317G0003 [Entamoeba nuttalli]|uniref:Retinoblatoma-binding protein 6, putative n=2 Tax=Entamoeba nuttalli TaxID=412467 RepID=K2I264_ENTNP|nr:Retinoblatoma-binding protein 6, putative [Entamoeba nuttalli P19]EKE42940.1 Retinoblatoma-binding protein 6, putative [Entamoeba nuttalli P19]|eukprot:XP_008854727.1 Retinoblatoma-binding protein 6, putative [Entamoeba nuttalli P19]
MSVSFSYTARFFSRQRELVISKPNALFVDAKQKIIEDMKNCNISIEPSQLVLTVGNREVNELDQIIPNTIIRVSVKEIEEKKEVHKEIATTKGVYIDNVERPTTQLINTRPKKQQRQLPPGYICNRCHKPGHYIKDCPENNNPAFDKKEAAGLPMEMYEDAPDDDPTAKTLKDGRRVRLRDMNGQGFKPTISKNEMSEEFDIPKLLKCKKCGGLLTQACFMRCCKNTLCEECLNEVRQKETCTMCGKQIDISKDIIIDKKTREEVQKYFDSINEKIGKHLTATNAFQTKNKNLSTKNTETKTNPTEEENELAHQIKVIDISELFQGNNRMEQRGRYHGKALSELHIDCNFNGKLIGVGEDPDEIIQKSFHPNEEEHKRSRSHSRERNQHEKKRS